MEKYSTVLLLSIAFLTGIFVLNGIDLPELNWDKASSKENYGEIQLDKNEAIDFRYKLSGYNISTVEKRPKRCPNHYSVWEPLSEMNCTFTEKGASQVTLITDAANYVDTPLGNRDYSLEQLDSVFTPWDLEFLPNGHRIVTSRTGEVYVNGGNKAEKVADINVIEKGETGLLGLAVHPKFEENRFVYLYYTYRRADKREKNAFKPFPVKNRVSRFRLEENLTGEKILLDEIPGNKYHSGGRLEFGPDNKLYISTGDAGSAPKDHDKPQKLDFLGGKVLRINPNGTVPEGNPFNQSYIYSRGHRNPQGLAWNPENGNLYTTEHGQWRHDEINRIVPGGNYGWGETQCNEPMYGNPTQEMISPVRCYKNWTMAPSGTTFVRNQSSPWYGDMFVTGLRGSHLSRLSIENNTVTKENIFYFSQNLGTQHRLRDVEYQNGSLWVIGDSKGLAKITP